MQIYASESLRRIRRLVSSLEGVVDCRIDTQDGGAIRALRISSEPSTDPAVLARRVRTALLRSLDVEVGRDQLSIQPAASSHRWKDRRNPNNHRSWDDSPGPSTAEPAVTDRALGDDVQQANSGAAGQREKDRDGLDDDFRSPDSESLQSAGARESIQRSSAAETWSFRFAGYAMFGDPTGQVQLRVRILTRNERFEGRSQEAALEDVTAETFLAATLRAIETALDAHPDNNRSSRILILEQDDVDQVGLADGRFVAAKVRALYRDGEKSATGFAPLQEGLREAAARAALDAVQRILEGRDSTSDKRRRGVAPPPRSDQDPFFTWS